MPSTRTILHSLVSKAFPTLSEVNDEAGKIARKQAADLAVGFSDAKRKRVRGIVARAITQGWSDQELELRLEGTVGLDQRYQQAVERLHASQLKAGVPRGTAYQNKLAYARRLRASRAKTIARTEISMALNGAQRILWQAGQASGEISPYAVRVSHTHKGSACKARCAKENGRRRSLKTTAGGPPFHPNCQCWETLEDKGTPDMDRALNLSPTNLVPLRKDHTMARTAAAILADARVQVAKAAKKHPKDGDGDGFIYDGKPQMQPAFPKTPKAKILPKGKKPAAAKDPVTLTGSKAPAAPTTKADTIKAIGEKYANKKAGLKAPPPPKFKDGMLEDDGDQFGQYLDKLAAMADKMDAEIDAVKDVDDDNLDAWLDQHDVDTKHPLMGDPVDNDGLKEWFNSFDVDGPKLTEEDEHHLFGAGPGKIDIDDPLLNDNEDLQYLIDTFDQPKGDTEADLNDKINDVKIKYAVLKEEAKNKALKDNAAGDGDALINYLDEAEELDALMMGEINALKGGDGDGFEEKKAKAIALEAALDAESKKMFQQQHDKEISFADYLSIGTAKQEKYDADIAALGLKLNDDGEWEAAPKPKPKKKMLPKKMQSGVPGFHHPAGKVPDGDNADFSSVEARLQDNFEKWNAYDEEWKDHSPEALSGLPRLRKTVHDALGESVANALESDGLASATPGLAEYEDVPWGSYDADAFERMVKTLPEVRPMGDIAKDLKAVSVESAAAREAERKTKFAGTAEEHADALLAVTAARRKVEALNVELNTARITDPVDGVIAKVRNKEALDYDDVIAITKGRSVKEHEDVKASGGNPLYFPGGPVEGYFEVFPQSTAKLGVKHGGSDERRAAIKRFMALYEAGEADALIKHLEESAEALDEKDRNVLLGNVHGRPPGWAATPAQPDEEEFAAIQSYTGMWKYEIGRQLPNKYRNNGGGYRRLNETLRLDPEDINPFQQEMVDILTRYAKKFADQHDYGDRPFYRGAESFGMFLDDRDLTGTTFTDKGVMSLTRKVETAQTFEKFGSRVFFEVQVPKGTPLIDVGYVSGFDNEGEIFLPPGASFRVLEDIRDINASRRYVKLEIIDASAVSKAERDAMVTIRSGSNRFVWVEGEIVVTGRPDPETVLEKLAKARQDIAKGGNRLNWSPKENWVDKAGGLPKYIEDIALALIKDGMPRERAIPTAISQVKRWAYGSGNVKPDTRAKALKACAQWKKMKAKSKGKG